MRASSPRRYRVSVVSSVRQTMRLGNSATPGLRLDPAPSRGHVPLLGLELPDAHAQGVLALELGVGEIERARAVEALEQLLIGGVSGAVPEADEVQGRGRRQFEIGICPH